MKTFETPKISTPKISTKSIEIHNCKKSYIGNSCEKNMDENTKLIQNLPPSNSTTQVTSDKQTCHPWHNSYILIMSKLMTSIIVLKMSRYFTCAISYAIYYTWNRHGATHLSLGSEQERSQFLGPNFLVILLHVELTTVGMKSRSGLRDPKEGCTPSN